MNRNFKIITINGIRGMITAIFIVMGLIAGFIISPGWVCMTLWNHLLKDYNIFAQMNLFQGIMLWLIIALSLYALNNKQALIGFGSYTGLNPEQIRDIMERSKKQEIKLNNESENIKKESEEINSVEKKNDEVLK